MSHTANQIAELTEPPAARRQANRRSTARLLAAILLSSLAAYAFPASGASFVYVANADDGEIRTYLLRDSGKLEPRSTTRVAPQVMAMAVSPDRRLLYASAVSAPPSLHAFRIDPGTGELQKLGAPPAVNRFPYLATDKQGRFLLAASYPGNLVAVYRAENDGTLGTSPLQVVPVGRFAHSIRLDRGNRYAYAATLGSDEMFQFTFDAQTGRLASSTPAVALMAPNTGPRHSAISPDNRFLFVLGEMAGTVTTFAIDPSTGTLAERSVVSGLPTDSRLRPGGMRGAGNVPLVPHDTANDIWAADIHVTPDGRFLYTSERTNSTLNAFAVDAESGRLAPIGSVSTEAQPRGFAIDPTGRFLVATGERSDRVAVYAIDSASGRLTRVGDAPSGRGANWVEIVAVD